MEEERVDEEQKVTKSVILKDFEGDFRHLRKNARSLISYVIMSGNSCSEMSLDL